MPEADENIIIGVDEPPDKVWTSHTTISSTAFGLLAFLRL
jgi:hypothetical protein